MAQDDLRIPKSFELARKQGMEWTFGRAYLKDVHPNSVKLRLTGESGRNLEIVASSPGGGRVEICQMDGLSTTFSRDQRNGSAVMVLECDQEIPEETVRMIENMKGIQKAASLAGMD